jgi:N-acetylmuramoyl-L-alanine amidase
MDGSTASLGSPVVWHEGRMVAPVRVLTDVIDPLVRERVVWSAEDRLLRLDRSDPNIAAVTFLRQAGETAVELRTSRELPAIVQQSTSRKGREVRVRIPGGVLPLKLTGVLPGVGLVDSVRTVQSSTSAELVFLLKSDTARLAAAARVAPTKVVLEFTTGVSAGEDDFADTTLASESEEGDEPAASGAGAASFAIRRIVLDPGHGGSDAGGSSARGDREKDIALTIARRLRGDLLARAPGLDVRLTREDDRFLTNDERRRIAGDLGADLFVSIHCDGWFDEDRRGFSVEVWGRSTVGDAWSLPASAVKDGGVERETMRLAESIAAEMDRAVSVPNRGVVSAELHVLESLRMPGLLIECGTLTNAEDRKLLVSDSFQEKISGAIADAIVEYRAESGAESDAAQEDAAEEGDGEL